MVVVPLELLEILSPTFAFFVITVPEIGAVIDAVNAEIVQFSETLSRRGVGKKAKVEPDDKPIIPPEEGGGGDGGGSDRPEIE